MPNYALQFAAISACAVAIQTSTYWTQINKNKQIIDRKGDISYTWIVKLTPVQINGCLCKYDQVVSLSCLQLAFDWPSTQQVLGIWPSSLCSLIRVLATGSYNLWNHNQRGTCTYPKMQVMAIALSMVASHSPQKVACCHIWTSVDLNPERTKQG